MMKIRHQIIFVCMAGITLLAGALVQAATTNVYVWNGSVDGNWFDAANWTGPSGIPGDTHDGSLVLDAALFASASNVTGTINYMPGTPIIFSALFINKSDATPLTVNINGNMTAEYQDTANPDWYESSAQIGTGGALTFNVNSGICDMQRCRNALINLAQLNVASGAEFRLISTSRPSGNASFSGQATIEGWLGMQTPTASLSTRGMPFSLYGDMQVDGGTLFPDYLLVRNLAGLTVTNNGTVRTRIAAAGIIMYGGVTAGYSNTFDLCSGLVTNLGPFRVAGVNANGATRPGISTATLQGGEWIQLAPTCIGDGRAGAVVAEGGTFRTPSDLYVGGARVGSDAAPDGVPYSGTLTVTGGTVVVSNPNALNPITVSGAAGKSPLRFGNWGTAKNVYSGQRVAFTSLKSGGAGVESNRIYRAAHVNSAGSDNYYYFGLTTNMTFGAEAVTGTPYDTGTGDNIYHTLPARLMIGNNMRFNVGGSTYLMNTGTLNMVSGTLTVDELVATNGAASILNISGGTLNTSASDVDTGSDLVIGDGSSAAMINLVEGTHSFDPGLTISANAALAVGGTNAIGSATITDDLTLQTDAILDVDFNETTNDWLVVSGIIDLPSQGTLRLRALDATTRGPIVVLQATSITGSPTGWARVTVNDIDYGLEVRGNQLVLGKPRGTLISIE